MPVKTITLVKIAAVGGIVLVGSAIGMKYVILQRFQQAEYFQKSTRIVLENKRLVELLGEPIQFGNPDLGDQKTNFSSIKEARFVVPIRGSQKKGLLHLFAERETQLLTRGDKDKDSDDSNDNEPTTGSDNNNANVSAIKTINTTPQWEIRKLELSLDDNPDRKIDLVKLALSSQ